MMKRFITVALAAIMCLSVSALTVFAAGFEVPQNVKSAKDNYIPDETQRLDVTDDIWISFTVPDSAQAIADRKAGIYVDLDWSINSETDWKCSGEDEWSNKEEYGKSIASVNSGEEVVNLRVFRASYDLPEQYGYDRICYDIDDYGGGF